MELTLCADHADLVMAKNRENTKVLFETEHSLVVMDEKMPCLFIASKCKDDYESIVQVVKQSGVKTMTLHQEELIPFFEQWEIYLKCHNLIYDKAELFKMESSYPIRLLNEKDVQNASMLYRKMDYHPYVEHCILRKVCYGMFDQGRLVGMIGEHDEEIMGLLEVHPDYRRKHLGTALLSHMMNVQRASGKPIVSQIKTDNTASFLLHEKLGFTTGVETVFWLRQRKRNI